MSIAPVVYVIDADGRSGAALQSLLELYAIDVVVFTTVADFIEYTPSVSNIGACVLLALDADSQDGASQVSRLASDFAELPLIVLCDTPDRSLREQYTDLGAADVVSKSMVDAYVFTRLAKSVPHARGLPQTPPSAMTLADGTDVTFRMISPEDAEMEKQFVDNLSDRSRYLRFFSGFKKIPDRLVKQLTDPRFPLSYAMIATIPVEAVSPVDAESRAAPRERQIAVARYAPTDVRGVAEFAVVVADEWQGQGIASELLRGVITAATVGGVEQLEGLILRENQPMLRLAEKLGFTVDDSEAGNASIIKVVKQLR